MRPLLAALLLCAICAAQAPPPPPAVTPQENSRQARALLSQAIAALGGPAYLDLQDMQQEGRTYSFFQGRPRDAGLLFWAFVKFPDKERVELTKQRDVTYLYNAGNGYEITYKGTRALDPNDVNEYMRQRRFSLGYVLRQWVNAPGVELFYEGRVFAENKPADQVSLLNSNNEGVTLFLDPETHLPVKKSFRWRDPETHDRNEETETYENYHLVQGIETAFGTTRYHNGVMSRQRFITRTVYNAGLADSFFAAGPVNYNPNKR